MLKSQVSSTPTLRCGSMRKSRTSYGLLLPGTTGGVILASDGSGMVLPSTPIRKALLGLDAAPPQVPPIFTFLQATVLPKPMPSAGVITSPTPFRRSWNRPYPARMTVFLSPRRLGRNEEGFQAKDKRGSKSFHSASYGYFFPSDLIGAKDTVGP